MPRYIDADELAIKFRSLAEDPWNKDTGTTWANAYEECADEVDDAPTADVVEVKHGTWIRDGYDFSHGTDWIHCSVCGKRGINVPADLTNFCPNCGADMRKDTEDGI